jgi:hypothetical protein
VGIILGLFFGGLTAIALGYDLMSNHSFIGWMTGFIGAAFVLSAFVLGFLRRPALALAARIVWQEGATEANPSLSSRQDALVPIVLKYLWIGPVIIVIIFALLFYALVLSWMGARGVWNSISADDHHCAN